MTKESQQWLDTMIKVGYTAPQYGRGDAWHRMEGNHNSYPDAVPFDDAFDLIASWDPVKVTPQYERDDGSFRPLKRYNGHTPVAIVHSELGCLLGIFSDNYPDHGYKERLFDALTNIIDDEINIGTCGLLTGYRKAWVQIEVPSTITHSSGVAYRPHIVAMSSLDGSLTTTYQSGVTVVVCDNTLSAFRKGPGEKHKVKNTANSTLKIKTAREALDIVFKSSESFEDELDKMLATHVSDDQWRSFLDLYVPVPADEGRGRTVALSKRLGLQDMWDFDEMVSPWSGTAFGVLQATNTWNSHFRKINADTNRVERNMTDVVTGKTAQQDQQAMSMLTSVLQ